MKLIAFQTIGRIGIILNTFKGQLRRMQIEFVNSNMYERDKTKRHEMLRVC